MITPDTALLGTDLRGQTEALEFTRRRRSLYPDDAVQHIIHLYWTIPPRYGMVPLLLFSQAVAETSAEQANHQWWPLSSWWSQPPRHNPAGIGVTGERTSKNPHDALHWQLDNRSGIWRKGRAFVDWDEAVQTHVQLLLHYALLDSEMNPQQLALAEGYFAHTAPAIEHIRGKAKTLRGLGGTWAADPVYGTNIANIANSILRISG
jgi:hypothetical protein